jgi:hypothetical protein
MSSIKVNLDHEVNFVLTDEENRVVAIINVPLGTTDIDNKISNAIGDDTGDSFQYFQTELDIQLHNSASEQTIEAFIDDENKERYLKTFYLTRTEIY